MAVLKDKVRQMEANEAQLIFETNTMKRKWKKLQSDKNKFEEESYLYQDEAMKYKTKAGQQAEMFENYHQELTLHEVNLRAQGNMLKSVQQERDRYLTALGPVRRNKVFTKAQQVDTMLNATRAIIAFNGWTNHQQLAKGKLVRKDVWTTTALKATQHDATYKFVQVPADDPKDSVKKKEQLIEASEEELRRMWKMPSTESGMQTDEDEFYLYLETIFPAFKNRNGKKNGLTAEDSGN